MYAYIYKSILNPFYENVIRRRNMLKYRAFLEKSQWWPYEKLRAFQWGELTRLLKHTYDNVPYWRGRFDTLGLKPADIKTYEDFCKIPVTGKTNMREHYEEMRADNYAGKAWKKSTGGSTGEPLHFEYTPESYDWRVACSKRGYYWAECEDGKRTAYIWGVAIGKTSELKRVKESLHHAFLRQRHYNCFGFTEHKMAEVLRDMNRFMPECIVGYTNPLYEFAKYVEKAGTLKSKPKTIISAAEKLHEFQREKISTVFGCPVFNTYGSREFMLIASECEARKGLHVNVENLFIEIIKENGTPAKPGEMGDIVITDLHNYGMPFIRYKIGDMGVASDRVCPCGKGLPMVEDIVGRTLDMIRTPDGKCIPGEFFPHLMKEFKKIDKFQVIQDKLDHLVIKMVQKDKMTDAECKRLSNEIEKVTGKTIKIDIAFTDEIPLTGTGKHRVTISRI